MKKERLFSQPEIEIITFEKAEILTFSLPQVPFSLRDDEADM